MIVHRKRVSLGHLLDVSLSALAAGDLLRWNGTAWVNSPRTLANLSDVALSVAANGHLLTYNSVSGKWINAAPAAQALAGLTDAAIAVPANGQVLTYNSGTGKWQNAGPVAQSLSGLSDVQLTGLASNDTVRWNGTKWVNIARTLANQTDVTIATPANGQVLTYDATGGKWKNANLPVTPTPNLSSLNDVSFSGLATGNVIQYNGTAWSNVSPTTLFPTLDLTTALTTSRNSILTGDTVTELIASRYDTPANQPNPDVALYPDRLAFGAGTAAADAIMQRTGARSLKFMTGGSLALTMTVQGNIRNSLVSSTLTERVVGAFTYTFPNNTDASRTVQLVASVTDYAASRNWLQVNGDGTTATIQLGTSTSHKIGFLGATPVARQTLSAALPTDGSANNAQICTAINALRTALINFGQGQ